VRNGPFCIALARSLLPNLTDPFIVMHGDRLTTLDFRHMIDFHRTERADFTLGLFPREVKIDFGVIELNGDGQFNGYREKPSYNFEVSMGVNVLSLPVLRHIKKLERLDIPELVLQVHRSGGRVVCYRETCRWLDIGRMDDYAQAQEEFSKNEAAFLRCD
jgi:NDP-sugar pyrophosphorylase family protein